jgi:hypothetical protein
VVAEVEVDVLGAAGLAGELEGVAVGAQRSDDVAAALAEVDAEDRGHACVRLMVFVQLAHFEVAI